jgi:hypothetical protein
VLDLGETSAGHAEHLLNRQYWSDIGKGRSGVGLTAMMIP